jgi:GNAT superfamily N-acetyltransferase
MILMPITQDSPAVEKAKLDDLLQRTFGITFRQWWEAGHWPHSYTCYTLMDDGQAQANISIYAMDLLIGGQVQRCLQVGAVATRPERRGQGLSRLLMDYVLALTPDVPFFLCANDSVLDFYPRFGFEKIPIWQPTLPWQLDGNSKPLRKMTLSDPAVDAYLNERACFSQVLDCLNAAPLHWFHLIYNYAENLYEIPELGLLVAAEQKGTELTILELWTTRPLLIDTLAPYLAFPGVRTIRFGFNPDWLGVTPIWEEFDHASPVFLRGDWGVQAPYILPLLLQT